MTTPCAYRLTSFEPVVEVLVRAEFNADGWSLWIRHRHHGGLFADCAPCEYERLSLEELGDVLLASSSQWGPFSPL